ncbi:hypothetical protein LTS18_013760 [Coniosporium uncinatum]|uniref:Uncharacterized protein n=1 Tax=Coniosporium uncinatum TaxID=93489 RepID=A0ACC3DVA6_9PEZI|nr:hypothetical protein LTS18_013760 [Coniosporium uncinatum]
MSKQERNSVRLRQPHASDEISTFDRLYRSVGDNFSAKYPVIDPDSEEEMDSDKGPLLPSSRAAASVAAHKHDYPISAKVGQLEHQLANLPRSKPDFHVTPRVMKLEYTLANTSAANKTLTEEVHATSEKHQNELERKDKQIEDMKNEMALLLWKQQQLLISMAHGVKTVHKAIEQAKNPTTHGTCKHLLYEVEGVEETATLMVGEGFGRIMGEERVKDVRERARRLGTEQLLRTLKEDDREATRKVGEALRGL